MDAERAIVLPRLSQDEQVGLALLKNVSPLTTVDDFEKAESTVKLSLDIHESHTHEVGCQPCSVAMTVLILS